MSIITRAEYMKQPDKLFEEFFAQFISNGTRAVALQALRKYPIEIEIDGHFNDMPVQWWDRYAENLPHDRNNYNMAYQEMHGQIWKSDLVCILKVACLKIMEGRGWRKIWRDDPHRYTAMRLRQRQGELRFAAITSEGDTWYAGREIRCVERVDGSMWKVVDKDVADLATTEFAIIEEEAMRLEEPIGWTEVKP